MPQTDSQKDQKEQGRISTVDKQLILLHEIERKERRVNYWRIISGLASLAAAAGIIYYGFIGVSWIYHKIFGGSNTAAIQQTYVSPLTSAGNVSPNNSKSAPIVSNANVIQIPNSGQSQNFFTVPNSGVNAGGMAVTNNNNAGNPGQINNPGGCPDYLGDTFACVR